MSSKILNRAFLKKDDEYYTLEEDVEKIVDSFKEHIKGKFVFCNCDDPLWSNFCKYFREHFDELGLKRLVSIGISGNVYDSDNGDSVFHIDDGSFDGEESIRVLQECDIVITNPPFSLFRRCFDVVYGSGKDFVIVSPNLCVSYHNIRHKVVDGKVFFYDGIIGKNFLHNGKLKAVAVRICSNIKIKTSKQKSKHYNQKSKTVRYRKYYNYDAIEVGRFRDIPHDYYGNVGVSVSALPNIDFSEFQFVEFSDEISTKIHMEIFKNGKYNVSRNNKGLFVEIGEDELDNYETYYKTADGKFLREPFKRVIIRRIKK